MADEMTRMMVAQREDEKNKYSEIEYGLYEKAIVQIEQMNKETKVKLMRKLAQDLELGLPYYCSECKEVSTVEFQHCSKCSRSFCEECCHEDEGAPTTFCDKCDAIFCRDCATREMANKLHCKNCRNKRDAKKRGKNPKGKEVRIELPMTTYLFKKLEENNL
jgi:hypothetical protein